MKIVPLLVVIFFFCAGVVPAAEIYSGSYNPPPGWWDPAWPIPPQVPDGQSGTGDPQVPEPSMMLLLGLGGLLLHNRRQKHKLS